MTLFLNGGGSGEQTTTIYEVFKRNIDTSKPLLYIPFAMPNEKYSVCFEWISEELAQINFPKIDMVISAEEITKRNLSNYSAIFIGGGNTYKLLKELKKCASFKQIKEYLENGGTVFGGSAGEILFGVSIDSCQHADPNEVNLHDTSGFDMVFGCYLGAHYTNKNPEQTLQAERNYKELSYKATVIALPEECTLVITNNRVSVIGTKDYYLFKKGERIKQISNNLYTTSEFLALTDTQS